MIIPKLPTEINITRAPDPARRAEQERWYAIGLKGEPQPNGTDAELAGCWQKGAADRASAIKTGRDYDSMEVAAMLRIDTDASCQFLVEGYLQRSQAMISGMAGAGKGHVGPLLASHITTGRDWWTGRRCKPGSVVIISPEDMPETIKQRCRFAGARVHGDIVVGVEIESGPRVICMGSGSMPVNKPDGSPRSVDEVKFFDTLQQLADDLQLIVIDPVKAFMGKRANGENEESHIRRVLSASLAWANLNQVAILLVIHPSKGAGGRHIDEQAAGSHAWTAVTRSNLALEKNPNYGATARVLNAGRQSNGHEGLRVVFDLEVGDAVDKQGERVPVVDDGGEIETDENGITRHVQATRLAYRETLDADHQYKLPPFDREGVSTAQRIGSAATRATDDDALRLAACELVANQPGGRMASYPDKDMLKQMGQHDTDVRWLHYACGHLARKFGISPRTIKDKVYVAFRKEDQQSVPGFITRTIKDGMNGGWFWCAYRSAEPDGEPY